MNVFDIVGPIMIGPSSSHTAGAVRIGEIARQLFQKEVAEADIKFHGSFAKTYKGHGTDKAIVGGILGMRPDDERIRDSLELAKEQGVIINITTITLDNVHPNTAVVVLRSADGDSIEVEGSSVGGGNIVISRLNGMAVEITGQYDTLIVVHRDEPGVVGRVADFLGNFGVNLNSIKLSRANKGGTAVLTIEVDGKVDSTIASLMGRLQGVIRCTLLNAV